MTLEMRPAKAGSMTFALAMSPLLLAGAYFIFEEGPSVAALVLMGAYAAIVVWNNSISLTLDGNRLTFRRMGLVRWSIHLQDGYLSQDLPQAGVRVPFLAVHRRSDGKVIGAIAATRFDPAHIETLRKVFVP